MSDKFAIDHIIGRSAWTERVLKRIVQVAGYRYSVLVTGPSGTGKELVARAIHTHGNRCEKPFIPVNCAAIPGGLFSSQLFGHVKGAFTGAQYSALGCFRAADGGTIFLDEIGELDMECQAKLLRVLQERVVIPVGAHEGETVDVRVIAATNRDLAADVRAGRFRLDLYYRLNVLSVETLGLKDRVEDVRVLATHFLAKTAVENGLPLKSLSPAALALMESYSWPGNVRELQNLIERAIVFAEGDTIGPEAFPQILRAETDLCGRSVADAGPKGDMSANDFLDRDLDELDADDSDYPLRPSDHPQRPPNGTATPVNSLESVEQFDALSGNWQTLAELEEAHVRRTLQETFFNQSAAARLLGVDRKLLARKMKKYGISGPSVRNQ